MNELGPYPSHDLLLFREADAPAIASPTCFRSVWVHTFKNPFQSLPDAQKRWALSTTQAFSSCARHIEYNQAQPFLFLEPDCVPIKKGWLDEIAAEYAQTKKPFMGFLVAGQSDSPSHLSGIAVYPGKVVEHAGQALMLDEQWPWDLSAADAIRPKAHFTDLIAHRWKRAPYTSLEEFYGENSKEAVLFHSQKTDALINLLRNQKNGGDAKCSQNVIAPTLCVDIPKTSGAQSTIQETGKNPPVQKPWKELTKKEKKARRVEQMARARAAKKKKASGGENFPAALPTNVSETSTCRADLSKYCVGLGIDLGFGGDPIVPTALTHDLNQPYTVVGHSKQILRGNAGNLNYFCDNALDYVFQSHLAEDWTYEELKPIVDEWRRILKVGGLLICNNPDQQRFLAHCKSSGQPGNSAHKEVSFGLDTFKSYVLDKTGPWEEVYTKPMHGPYSWLGVWRKQ